MSDLAEFHLRLPKELHASVKKLATESGVSANYWIVDMLQILVNSKKLIVYVADYSIEGGKVYEVRIPEDWLSRNSPRS